MAITMDPSDANIDEELIRILERFEKRRKAIVKKLTTAFLGIGALAAIALIIIVSSTPHFMGVVIVLMITGLISFGTYSYLTKNYVREYKREVIGRLVKSIDESLRYSPGNYIGEGTFRRSQIFKKGIDRYRGEDHVSGKLGKTEFEFSEVHAEYKTRSRDSKGNTTTRWHTIFKGLFFIADFNKHFHGETVVLPDTAESLFGGFGRALQKMNIFRGKLITLEDPEFERHFAVYSDDQVEARYILSPALMQRIKDFRNKTRCQVFMSFVDSRVFVAISTKENMFEPKVFSTVLSRALINEYLEDLHLAIGIVEDLNLNTRIWTKE